MRIALGLRIYTSNRMEALVERLAEIMREPLASVLQPERVVVQSLGMRRWLALELAARHGICANVEFPFPQTMVGEIFEKAFPDQADEGCYDPTAMTWRIMKLLPAHAEKFPELGNYLAGGRAELKRFQLAGKIAEVFDRYLAFRPEMILGWESGKEKHWQAVLWRELVAGIPRLHQPALGLMLDAAFSKGGIALDAMPERIFVFGISTLPKFHLELLAHLARKIDVHFFLLEPTLDWWGDLVSERETAKILARQKNADATADEMHLESGNELLASMGRQGREFLGVVADLERLEEIELFEPPGENTMLDCIQADMFRVENPEVRRPVSEKDVSVQVHSCHNPMREMEVLHDQLLALFEARPGLMPKDVLVMIPDIKSYAVFIEAVFNCSESEHVRIPFSIADRPRRAESSALNAFLQILELVGTRLNVSSVLAVLESSAIQRKFGLADADLEAMRVWIEKTAIRWGIDAKHRAKFGVPEFSQNSWREGLDRMLLGYAMPGGGERLFAGLLPFDEIEGGTAQTLGGLVEFTSQLFDVVAGFERPRRLDEWQQALRSALDRMFDETDQAARELIPVRRVMESLGETMRRSGFDEPVPFAVLLAHLSNAFSAEERGSGFLAGRVTFCALKPMRSIPAKVLCLAGMNDGAFPRHSPALSFDLIAQNPKPGDRTTRDDDRHLFLEAILSAREVLCISYCGQSMRDNSTLPPSVLVSELLDYLERGFELPEKNLLADLVVTKHRLQPFSPEYYKGGRLFSYSQENCGAGEVAQRKREAPAPFLSQPIGPPEEEFRTISVNDLVDFFGNPSRFFAKKRLGIALPDEEGALDDREPFELDWRVKYRLGQELAERSIRGEPLDEALPIVRASGDLPPAQLGDVTFRKLANEAEAFAKIVQTHAAGEALPPFPISLKVDEFTITGAIDGVIGDALVRYRLADMKAKDMLATWVPLVALNCIRPGRGVLIAKDTLQMYRQVENAEAILRSLLKLYWLGLREPLKFFPQSSWEFARFTIEPDDKKNPIEEATKAWDGGERSRGEIEDEWFDLAFHNTSNPLDDEWRKIALEVYRPLIEHREESNP